MRWEGNRGTRQGPAERQKAGKGVAAAHSSLTPQSAVLFANVLLTTVNSGTLWKKGEPPKAAALRAQLTRVSQTCERTAGECEQLVKARSAAKTLGAQRQNASKSAHS